MVFVSDILVQGQLAGSSTVASSRQSWPVHYNERSITFLHIRWCTWQANAAQSFHQENAEQRSTTKSQLVSCTSGGALDKQMLQTLTSQSVHLLGMWSAQYTQLGPWDCLGKEVMNNRWAINLPNAATVCITIQMQVWQGTLAVDFSHLFFSCIFKVRDREPAVAHRTECAASWKHRSMWQATKPYWSEFRSKRSLVSPWCDKWPNSEKCWPLLML